MLMNWSACVSGSDETIELRVLDQVEGAFMLSIPFVLYLIAFALTLISGITNRVPLWIAVLLVCIGLMIGGVVR
jgi:hypothetical protein